MLADPPQQKATTVFPFEPSTSVCLFLCYIPLPQKFLSKITLHNHLVRPKMCLHCPPASDDTNLPQFHCPEASLETLGNSHFPPNGS